MRVLVFSLAYLPFVGGAELAVKEITERLPHIDFDLVTANLDGKQPQQERIGAVTVYRLGRGPLAKYTYPRAAKKFASRLHQQHAYDAVWAIMANQAGLAASGFKKKFPTVRYVLTLQEGDSLGAIWLRTWFMRSRYKAIYRRADHIQAISKYLLKRAVQYGYTGARSIIPNGVAIDHFARQRTPAELHELRTKLGIASDVPVVVSASRLVHKNALDIVIKAMAKIETAHLVLLGTGSLEERLRKLSRDLHIERRVHFVGHVDHRLLPAYLQLSAVFVRPSRSEGLGSAFLEAMAAGVPVVATPVGGIVDFLHDGQNGLFCKVDSADDVAEKVNFILTHPTQAAAMSVAARTMVHQHYDWRDIANRMASCFIV